MINHVVYQASYLSAEFLTEIRKFRAIKEWGNEHIFALTQLILIEAIRDTTFDYAFYFNAEPTYISELHGKIDCLLYQRYDLEPGNIGNLILNLCRRSSDSCVIPHNKKYQ